MEQSVGNLMSKNTNCFNVTNVTNITEENSQILAWISSLEYRGKHRDLSHARVKGVGDWVLETPEFQKWRDGGNRESSKVLFCCGIPGSGKTFFWYDDDQLARAIPYLRDKTAANLAPLLLLSSLVIDNLCDSKIAPKARVACLYCDYGGWKEQTPVGMISSLLRQFVTGMEEIPEELAKAFRDAKGQLGGRALEVEKIIDILSKVLESFDRSFICVDALDEFRVADRARFLQLLKITIDKSPNTRLLLTGRQHIRQELDKQLNKSITTITVQPRNGDIRQYLSTRLDNDIGDGLMNDGLREEIIMNITRKDSEIFLLVALHIDAILGETTIRGRRERLYQMGNDLSDAYGATIERIKEQPRERSRLGMAALMWISLAERPLSVKELCHALAVKAGTSDFDSELVPLMQSVLGCCLGLVRVDQETSTVRLIHATLQEHLRGKPDIFGSPHTAIAELCLSYLGFRSVQELSVPLEMNSSDTPATGSVSARLLFLESVSAGLPLLEYASCYWGMHAQKGLTDSIEQSAIKLLSQYPEYVTAKIFLKETDLLLFWKYDSEGFSGLHYASWTGSYQIVVALLRTGNHKVGQKDASGRTPLSLAAQNGHREVVEILLEHRDVDPDSIEENGRTPLSRAAEHGHGGVAMLLLNRGDVNPDFPDKDGRTPLSWATEHGHEGVVRLLLGRTDVDPNFTDDDYGQTPLSWAAGGGHEGVVEILLDRAGIDPNLADRGGRTPLSRAAEHGHGVVVNMLLDQADINPNLADSGGRTPLSRAAEHGYEGVVNTLLERADVNSAPIDLSGQTMLHLVAKNGHHGVVRLLLERTDLYPDPLDMYLRTPLSWAAGNWCLKVMELLLNWTDADPNSVDVDGRTPLSWAAAAGCEEAVALLLRRGDVSGDIPDIDGQTPLFGAARSGHKGIVRLLLNHGDVHPERLDKNGRTVISWAAESGREEVVKILLEWTGICPDFPDHRGRTSLSWAAGKGHQKVVELLLTRVDVNAECMDSEGRSPLYWALRNNHEGVAAVLQKRGK